MDDNQATADSTEDFIGDCVMEEDGTLVMRLRATGPMGLIGNGVLKYPTNHPNYAEILQHIGPIKPGENKPVRPFPD